MALAFVFSAAVGVFFGVYPAYRASQTRPDRGAALRVAARLLQSESRSRILEVARIDVVEELAELLDLLFVHRASSSTSRTAASPGRASATKMGEPVRTASAIESEGRASSAIERSSPRRTTAA